MPNAVACPGCNQVFLSASGRSRHLAQSQNPHCHAQYRENHHLSTKNVNDAERQPSGIVDEIFGTNYDFNNMVAASSGDANLSNIPHAHADDHDSNYNEPTYAHHSSGVDGGDLFTAEDTPPCLDEPMIWEPD